jgi:hypothetical protein
MSRRVYLLGMGLALVALGLALTDWALSLRPGVTEANVRRIRPGMTFTQLEALLGQIDVVETTQDGKVLSHQEFVKRLPADCDRLEESGNPLVICLFGENGVAAIRFGRGARVVSAEWEAYGPPATPLARLRAWLGW